MWNGACKQNIGRQYNSWQCRFSLIDFSFAPNTTTVRVYLPRIDEGNIVTVFQSPHNKIAFSCILRSPLFVVLIPAHNNKSKALSKLKSQHLMIKHKTFMFCCQIFALFGWGEERWKQAKYSHFNTESVPIRGVFKKWWRP